MTVFILEILIFHKKPGVHLSVRPVSVLFMEFSNECISTQSRF